jgi:hypothetical protein
VEVRHVGVERPGGRELLVARLARPDAWPDQLELPTERFTLFLALDARQWDDYDLTVLARRAFRQGLAYFVAWGPGSTRAEIVFDLVDEWRRPPGDEPIPTTSIADELDEALWFTVCVAYHPWYDETFRSVLCVSLDNDEWHEAIERLLRDFEGLNRRLVGDE